MCSGMWKRKAYLLKSYSIKHAFYIIYYIQIKILVCVNLYSNCAYTLGNKLVE